MSSNLQINKHANEWLRLFEAELLSLVEKIFTAGSQVDNISASVSVLLHQRALLAIIGITSTGSPANNAPSLVRSIVALITNTN